MIIHWKAVALYFIVALFVFQFSNLGQFISFGLGTVRSERVKTQVKKGLLTQFVTVLFL